MRKSLIAVAAVALAVAAVACAPSPPEICKRGVALTCSRTFECNDDATKGSDPFKAIFGTSVEDCNTRLAALGGCDSKLTEDDLCKVTGADGGVTQNGKFSLSNASACSDARKALSCADFKDPTKTPEVCKKVCGN
jgi:hypothetical protein